MTKLSSNKTVRRVRVRGGNFKFRALRLDTGNYSWGSEAVTRKVRILDVVYNSSNNELVRTQTLVKNAVVQVDAAPFRQWYSQHYGLDIGKKKKTTATKKDVEVIELFHWAMCCAALPSHLFLFCLCVEKFIESDWKLVFCRIGCPHICTGMDSLNSVVNCVFRV
jgi:ribosomal protein eS8